MESKIKKVLRLRRDPAQVRIVRHSVDARKMPQLSDIYTVDVNTGLSSREEAGLVHRLRDKNVWIAPRETYVFPAGGQERLDHRPVVIGAGPAGLFCALFLAEHGYRPLLIERGRRMEERTKDVDRFWREGVLDPGSNVQFGEGGAGTFSDGKLNTQINDKTGRSSRVLEIFVEEGAPESILYDSKPHIGTDRLREVIPNIRRRIERAGGEVRFETVCTGFVIDRDLGADSENASGADSRRDFGADSERDSGTDSGTGRPGRLTGIRIRNAFTEAPRRPSLAEADDSAGHISGGHACAGPASVIHRDPEGGAAGAPDTVLPAQVVVLAIGHSARDTVMEIHREQIPMEQKQFAVGFRVAHPQSLIDKSQYGISDPDKLKALGLSASPYKLTARASSGRGVYSFCMCPGGYIVNASSEEGHVCVNGMSDEGRDSGSANSAIVITVGEKEFGSADVLAGMDFQRRLEKKAFELGQGRIPVQMFEDFRASFYRDRENTGYRDRLAAGLPDGQKTGAEESGHVVSAGMHGQETHTGIDGQETGTDQAVRSPGPEYYGQEPLLTGSMGGHLKGACRPAPLHTLLPADLTADFIEGMDQFGRKIRGFDGPEAVVAGIESRTSSPVRITRTKSLESVGAAGLYPCGEGAGYAGGIMSAAMDGMRVAEAIARRYAPLDAPAAQTRKAEPGSGSPDGQA